MNQKQKEPLVMEKSTIRANDFAPRDGRLSVFFKKMFEKKSDGFAAVFDGEVYVIDVGGKRDGEMLRFLTELRAEWLKGARSLADAEKARLEIHVIISHSHPDHVGALPFLLADPRLCVVELLAPRRSYRSLPGPDFLPELAAFEERLHGSLSLLSEYHHKTANLIELPYGKVYSIRPQKANVEIDIYTAPFDWSENEEAYRYLIENNAKNSIFYVDHPEVGCANGSLNGNSLWVRIRKGKKVILITGDQRADDAMLGRMIRHYGEEPFRCDVLKLLHHGTNCYPPKLIQIASPSITIFTVFRELATPETVAHCERVSTPYFLGGKNLILTLDGESIEAKQYE